MEKKQHICEFFDSRGLALQGGELSKAIAANGISDVSITLMPGRCGSTIIANYARNYGFGRGAELFNELSETMLRQETEGNTPQAYFNKVVESGSLNGRLYFQITPNRLKKLLSAASADSLRAMSPTVTLILRRDVFAQALSFYNAVHSGIWHSRQQPFRGAASARLDWRKPLANLRSRLGRVVGQSRPVGTGEAPELDRISKWVGQILRSERDAFTVMDMIGVRPAAILFYEDIATSPVAAMIAFLAANGQTADVARIVAAIEAKSNVTRLARPDAAAQYAAMSTSLPGFHALCQLRQRDPLAGATYQAFSDHGYL